MTTPSGESPQRPTEPAPAPAESPTVEHPPAAPAPAAEATFAPIARPPRTPWVNPAKRPVVAIGSALATIVLLGGGFVTGYLVGNDDDGDGRGDRTRIVHIDGGLPGPGMRMHPGQGNGPYRILPRPRAPQDQDPSVTPTPSPSASG